MLARVPAAKRELTNSSDLDAGLALAASLVSKQNGPTRIIAFTDNALRTASTNALAIAAVNKAPSGTLLHVIDFYPSGDDLDENSEPQHRLAAIAKRFGGTLVSISGDTTIASDNRHATAHLVSPTRLENVTLKTGAGIELSAETFPAGSGFRALASADVMPHEVRISGTLWSRPWRRSARRSNSFSRLAAKLALADNRADLTGSDYKALALSAGVISDATSFLATDMVPFHREGDIGGGWIEGAT